MAAKHDSGLNKPLLKPSVTNDNQGCFIYVSCGNSTARFYLDKLDESKRSLGKCVLLEGSWYTPSEFESHCQKKTKKWRQSIMHSGKPLSEYSLSCPPKQGAKHASCNVDTQPNCVQGNLQQGRNQGATRSAYPLTPSNSSHRLASPLLINAVLSFLRHTG